MECDSHPFVCEELNRFTNGVLRNQIVQYAMSDKDGFAL